MKRFFRVAFLILSMVVVMLVAAAITLRLALHAGEVSVPNFSGMTVAEATQAALHSHLDLNIENKFYSVTVPAGRILSQAPAAGSRVRDGWQARVTESLGPQQVVIPDVTGEPEREAAIDLRRMSLNLGTLAHIEAPGDPDIVLTQSPPPNAGVDQPRVSLLLSTTSGSSNALVTPSFVGMSYAAASHIAAALGLRVSFVDNNPPPTPSVAPAPATAPAPVPGTAKPPTPSAGSAIAANPGATPATPPAAPAAPAAPGGPVTAQSPESGYRIGRGDTVRLIFGHVVHEDTTTKP